MRVATFLLIALVAGLASAAPKQINTNTPPPPPLNSGTAPGVEFGVVVSGYTQLTWTNAQSDVLCSGLKNLTSGYPLQYISCQVTAVLTTSTPGINAVTANGNMIWQQFTGNTAADQTSASNSRNLFASRLKSNETIFSSILPSSTMNNTCSAGYVPGTAATPSAEFPVAGLSGGARCRIVSRGAALTETTGTESLRFTAANSLATTVSTIGIDNGKICPYGSNFIIKATPVTSVAFLSTTDYLACSANTGGGSWTCRLGKDAGVVTNMKNALANVIAGVRVRFTGTFLSNPGNLVLNAGTTVDTGVWSAIQGSTLAAAANNAVGACDQPALNALTAALNNGEFTLSGGAQAAAGAGAAGTFNSFTVVAGTGACNPANSDGVQIFKGSAAAVSSEIAVTGLWSPSCDTDNAFYTFNSNGGTTGSVGLICPACISGTNKQQFVYSGPNAGKYCSLNTSPALISGTPSAVDVAGGSGTSCIGPIGVNDQSGNVNNAKPMLTTGVKPSDASGILMANVFPTPSTTGMPGQFAADAVVAFGASGATLRGVAIDTEFGVPCSTPQMTQGTTTSVTPVGIINNYQLPTTGAGGAGTCNTQSLFWNGGTSTNGYGIDAYSGIILSSAFTAPLVNLSPPPPPPSPPTIAPASPPAKPPTTPSPSPSPSPITPSPAPAVTCTYSGTYLIESVGCSGKFIAYTNDPNTGSCKNATLMLRTAQQSKSPRNNWKLSATAVSGTVPTATGMIASGRSGKCTNDKYTNLAAANSSPTPRLAGSGWKNRIIPVDAAKGCNTVWIQAAGDNPFAGKYLGYGSCSSQTAFKWEAASSSSAIQWKLTKQ